jgi:2-haloacid dehalogenase
VPAIDVDGVTHLTFDCYGTIIDWETGILDAVRPVLAVHGADATDADVLGRYAHHEAAAEGGPYMPYAEVLRHVLAGLGADFGFVPSEYEKDGFSRSVPDWPPFPDSRAALEALGSKFDLVILSNIDDDLFAGTRVRLGVAFDEIITAEQVGSYKPSRDNFRFALERLGVKRDRVVHVAQSLYHDHVPAKELGWTTVWVNRPSRRPGAGVALPAEALPDAEVPDMAGVARLFGVA